MVRRKGTIPGSSVVLLLPDAVETRCGVKPEVVVGAGLEVVRARGVDGAGVVVVVVDGSSVGVSSGWVGVGPGVVGGAVPQIQVQTGATVVVAGVVGIGVVGVVVAAAVVVDGGVVVIKR